MRPQLVVATTNAGKLREFRQLAASGPLDGLVDLVGLGDPALGGQAAVVAVSEESMELAENAAAKAVAAAQALGRVAVADDSGLFVDALGGRPGPWSARYAGPGATDAMRVAKLLGELAGVPAERRTARFRCALAVALPEEPRWGAVARLVEQAGFVRQGRAWVRAFEGSCEGRIALQPAGQGGFGYDPIFWVPEVGATFAELDPATKNRLSHRARAWRQAEPLLVELFFGRH